MAAVGALIVDDEDDIRELMKIEIDIANHGLFVAGEAGDGVEALEWIAEFEPAVVVLDERMPRMNGLETARRMLADRPDRKIVLCSAYLDAELQREAMSVGISTCLPKRDISRLPEVLFGLSAS